MVKHVYDDEKIQLKARITGAPKLVAQIKKTDFVITKIEGPDLDETDLAPIHVKVPGGYPETLATYDYEPETVPDGLDYYDIKYVAKIKLPSNSERLQEGKPEIHRIWPSKAEVVFTSEDGEAHKQAKFKIKCKGKTSGVKTADEDGKWDGQLAKGKYTVIAVPPYELVEPEHVGRKRTYEIKKNPYTLEFVEPKAAGTRADDKQYVNLDAPTSGWSVDEPFGHLLTFVVGAVGDADLDEGERLAQEGDIVYIEVKFTPETQRNDPPPRLLDDGLDGLAVASNGNKTWKGKVKIGSDRRATFKVELGYAGGDSCDVSVGVDDSCGDATLSFENWRRLYYEVMYPEFMTGDLEDVGNGDFDVPGAVKAEVDARLGDVFIEYVRTKSHKFTREQAPEHSVVRAQFTNDTGRDRFVQGGEIDDTPPVPFGATDDRTLQLTLCDRSYGSDTTRTTERPTFTTAVYRFGSTRRFVPMNIPSAKWEALIADPSVYEDDPTVVLTTTARPIPLGGRYTIKITELGQNKSKVVSFEGTDVTPAGEGEDDIRDLVSEVLNEEEVENTGNTVRFQIAYPHRTGTDDRVLDDARHDEVVRIIRDEIATVNMKVYNHPGVDCNGDARTGHLELTAFHQLADFALDITLPTSTAGLPEPGDFVGAAETATHCQVRIVFEIVGCGAINGQRWGVRQLLALRPPPRTVGSTASTMCHELGHAMGMTIMTGRSKIPPGCAPANTVDSSGLYYIDGDAPYTNGKRDIGKGPHCAAGVQTSNLSHSTFNGEAGSCIMFHSGGDADIRPSFCDVCTRYIKARRLTDLRTSWAARLDSEY